MAEIVSRTANIVYLDGVGMKRVDWLWKDRIPLGMFSLIAGVQGRGKSTLALYMAAQVSTGRPWADSQGQKQEVGSTILFSAEDPLEHLIVPRLTAAQADLSKIAVVPSFKCGEDERGLYNLTKDAGALEDAASRMPDLKLVIIDPISSYMTGKDENKNAEIREFLTPLAKLAEQKQFALVGIDHLNKNSEASAECRVIGSVGKQAVARSVWLVHEDDEDPKRRLMLFLKGNLTGKTSGLAYRIDEVPILYPDGKTEPMGRCLFEPDPIYLTARDVLNPQKKGNGRPRKKESAGDWLLDYLADGPKSSADVYRAGGTHEPPYSEATLKRAKEANRVQAIKMPDPSDPLHGHWDWALPTN